MMMRSQMSPEEDNGEEITPVVNINHYSVFITLTHCDQSQGVVWGVWGVNIIRLSRPAVPSQEMAGHVTPLSLSLSAVCGAVSEEQGTPITGNGSQ